MKTTLTVTVLAIGMIASGAMAADAPLIVDESAFEMASPWTGFYAGVGATGGRIEDETFGYLDGIAGFNWQSDAFVLGAEAWLSGWRSSIAGPGLSGGAEIRAGYLVTPEVLTYVSAGVMHFLRANGATYAQLGAGVEFMVADDMSVDLEYKHWQEISGGGIFRGDSVSASVLWHF